VTDLWCPIGGNNAMMLHRIVTLKYNTAYAHVVRIHATATSLVVFVAVITVVTVVAYGERRI
jgi:hypothetical protein